MLRYYMEDATVIVEVPTTGTLCDAILLYGGCDCKMLRYAIPVYYMEDVIVKC